VACISPAYTAQNSLHIGSVCCIYNKKTKIDLRLKLGRKKYNNNNNNNNNNNLTEAVVTKNFLKYLENIALTKSILRVEQKEELLQMYHIVCKFPRHAPLPQGIG